MRAAEAEEGNIAWLTSVRRGRPYVIWKSPSTLDGRSAAADGTSMWITSEAARMDVHRLRGTVDAMMVGVGTMLADDPRLTTRDLRTGSLAIRQPLRVVVDSHGRTPAEARVRDGAAPTWIATTAEFGAGRGRPGGSARGARGAAPARRTQRAAGGRAHGWPERSWPPAWSTGSSSTSRRSCSATARPRSSARG